MNFRLLNASLGLLAAAGTIAFITVRTLEAAKPVATPVELLHGAATPLTLTGLAIEQQTILTQPLSLPAAAGTGATAAVPTALGTAQLEVGRPADVVAQFGGAASAPAVCRLVPRPHGACRAVLRVSTATTLSCEYVCDEPAEAKDPK